MRRTDGLRTAIQREMELDEKQENREKRTVYRVAPDYAAVKKAVLEDLKNRGERNSEGNNATKMCD